MRAKVLVDSYGWIEFLTNGPLAESYARYLKQPDALVTPSIVVYEVYKKIYRERGKEEARKVMAQMLRTQVVPLDEDLALAAAEVSVARRLSMADAIILATAQRYGVKVVTSDPHFQNFKEAIYLEPA